MNTETFDLPKPTPEEEPVIHAWLTANPDGVTVDNMLAGGNAPPEAHALAQRRQAYMDDWGCAERMKDRPITRRIEAFGDVALRYHPEVSLFGGSWLEMGLDASGPEGLFAGMSATLEGVDGELFVCAVAPWHVYKEAIKDGDERRCRQLAAAIYEYLGVAERARVKFIETVREIGYD